MSATTLEPLAARRPTRPAVAERLRGSRDVAPARLTRRGRAVLSGVAVVLVLLAVAAAAVLLARPVGAGPRPGESGLPVGTTTVVVAPGDSLWDIAEAVAPGVDPREFVHEVERRNDVSAGSLPVGVELVVPTG